MYHMPRLVPALTDKLKHDRTVHSGDIFRHFKGGVYQVIGIAKNTETEEPLVVYSPLLGEPDLLWARPLEMFLSKVDFEKHPDAQQPYRMVKMTVEE